MSFALFFELFTMMFRDPRAACSRVLALNWPARAVWDALGLVTIGGIFSLKIVAALSMQTNRMTVLGSEVDPTVGLGIGQTLALIMGAWMIARVGRLFGGHGSFIGAITLVTWLQATLLTVQVLQLLLMLTIPPLAIMVSLATLFLIIWWFAALTAELHGFARLVPVVVGLFLGASLLLIGLALLMGLLGVNLQLGIAQP